MSGQSASTDAVRVYGLAPPRLLVEAGDALGRAVRAALGVADPARHVVSVSGSSGWLSYADRYERAERSGPPQLPSAEGAKTAGEAALRALAAALGPSGPHWPARLGGVTPLPPVFRPAGMLFVASPRHPAFDAWLLRAQAFLPVGDGSRDAALVLGAQAEVRIGDQGRVVGFVVRWRALSGEVHTVPHSPLHAEEGSAQARPEGGARLVYLLAGDGVPQYYLAPYHLLDGAHHPGLHSASPYSLVVDITQADTGEGATLTARALGGSGNYAYSWARYALEEVLDSGIETLGGGVLSAEPDEPDQSGAGRERTVSSIGVGSGAWIVMVNVKDRASGAFFAHQQQVFAGIPVPVDVPAGQADGGWGS